MLPKATRPALAQASHAPDAAPATSRWERIPLYCLLFVGVLAVFAVVEHDMVYANSAIREIDEDEIRDIYIEQIESGLLLRKVTLLAFGGFGAVALLSSRGNPWNVRYAVVVPLVLLFAWACLSIGWSTQAGVSLKRVTVLACILSGTAGLARWLTMREVLTGALVTLSLFVSTSFAIDLASGGKPWGADYRFSGTLHPNAQAAYLGILCLAAFCQPIGFGRRWILRVVFLSAFALLILTKSRTGLVALIGALICVWILRLPSRVRWAGIAVLACCLASVVIYFSSVGDGARNRAIDTVLLGRTEQASTLTGRVPLWEELGGLAADRPITGYGYEGFWSPDRIAAIMKSQNWSIQSAHNAYLDITLELGVVGLALAVWVLVAAGSLLVSANDKTRDPGYAFGFGVLAFGATNSLLESLFTDIRYSPAIALVGLMHVALFFPKSGTSPAEQSTAERPLVYKST